MWNRSTMPFVCGLLVLVREMVDIFERQIELVFVMLRGCRNIPCRDRSARGESAYLAGIIERHDAIVEEIGRGDRRLAVIELGESDLGVGIDERLLVDAPDALHVADVEGVVSPAITRTFAFELAMLPSRLSPSPAPPIGFQ